MGDAKAKKTTTRSVRLAAFRELARPDPSSYASPVPAINGARIRVLTGDDRIPDSTQISSARLGPWSGNERSMLAHLRPIVR